MAEWKTVIADIIITCLPLRGFLIFTSGLIRLGSGSHFWCINAWESIYTTLEFPSINFFVVLLLQKPSSNMLSRSHEFAFLSSLIHFFCKSDTSLIHRYNYITASCCVHLTFQNNKTYLSKKKDCFSSTLTCWLKSQVNNIRICCCMPKSWT